MTSVFISWSGDTSREIAEELRNWIPSVLQFAKPYYTPNDIEKGAKWGQEVSQKLSEANVGIICLTRENYEKPWILFEAGALSKDLKKSRVCSILFGMENTDITGPLTTFQTTEFRKQDFKSMMKSINESGGDHKLNVETFDRVFDMWWPQLEETIGKIIGKERGDTSEVRSDRELLEEILILSRSSQRGVRDIPPWREDKNFSIAFLEVLRSLIESVYSDPEKRNYREIQQLLGLSRMMMSAEPKGSDLWITVRKLVEKFDDIPPF